MDITKIIESYQDTYYDAKNVTPSLEPEVDDPRYKFKQTTGSAFGSTWLEWYKDGVLHRDDDNPAFIVGGRNLVWYKNGQASRAGNKVAHATPSRQVFGVNGFAHRTDGPAVVHLDEENGTFSEVWCLYGAKLNEERHSFIMQTSLENNLPIWVSFLYSKQILNFNDIKNLKKEDKTSNLFSLPIAWVLKSLNVESGSLYFCDWNFGKVSGPVPKMDIETFVSIASQDNTGT